MCDPTLDLDPRPSPTDAAPPGPVEDRTFSLLGVRITDVTRGRALRTADQMLREKPGRPAAATSSTPTRSTWRPPIRDYRDVLNAADYVFGDGTGVRWAARLHGLRVRDNLVGTDLVPQLLRATAAEGYRYFLLGGDEATIARAAATAAAAFPAGRWPAAITVISTTGTLPPRPSARSTAPGPTCCWWAWAIRSRSSGSTEHRRQLEVPLCLGVGGLFHYWAGDLRRAPAGCAAGGRMARHALPAAAQGPPLSLGQSALPLADPPRAGLTGTRCYRHEHPSVSRPCRLTMAHPEWGGCSRRRIN